MARCGAAGQACGLGALSGLLCFLPSGLLQAAVIAVQGKEAVLGPLREQAEGLPAVDIVGFLEDPAVFAVVVLFGLLFEAVALIGMAAAGGAIAVRIAR